MDYQSVYSCSVRISQKPGCCGSAGHTRWLLMEKIGAVRGQNSKQKNRHCDCKECLIAMPEYEAIIGLETHIQLNTTTKIFCTCKADSWDDPANTNICPVCTGLPGVLPVLNERVVEKGALLAAAMQAEIQPISYFDRKNYFYPDLPKASRSTRKRCWIATTNTSLRRSRSNSNPLSRYRAETGEESV